MSSLRTVIGIVVLAAILYLVYVSVMKNPKAAPLPDGAAGFASATQGDLLNAVTPEFAAAPGGSASTSPAAGPSGFPSNGPAYSAVTPPSSAPQTGPANYYGTAQPPANPTTPATAPPGAAPPVSVSIPGGPSPLLPPVPSGGVATAPPANSAASTPSRYPSTGLAEMGDVIPSTPPANPTSRGAANPPAGPAAASAVRPEFALFMQEAYKSLGEGRWSDTHLTLSRFYGNPQLTTIEARTLLEVLDQLAGTVIYSRQHLLEQPYRVRPDDSLDRIARSYDVPAELLAKINGIRDPRRLTPGMDLKVLHGPFDAIVDLGRYELTLMLKGRYAGRFLIGIGRDLPQLEGQYTVRDKKTDPVYIGPDRVIASSSRDPSNPWGKRLIELGSQVGIHGTNDPHNIGRNEGRGSIALGDRDIEDVFDILSIGSRVVIRR
jgi:LysM repeat protein